MGGGQAVVVQRCASTTPYCTLSDVASGPAAVYIPFLGVPLTERFGPDGSDCLRSLLFSLTAHGEGNAALFFPPELRTRLHHRS
jgi:hypothetical protein